MASQPCPCHLAETGDCILCSQLAGKDFCDCCNFNGVCIYQEYVSNNFKAKEGRKYYHCKILEKNKLEDNVIILTVGASDKLVSELVYAGSYIFARRPDTETRFDTPISILDTDTRNNTITIAIELKGTKTKALDLLKLGEELLVKGPFWNGTLGLKNIYKVKNSICLIVARGIGQAPMIPVLKYLHANNNENIVVLDNSPYKNSFVSEYLEKYASKVIQCNTIENGRVTDEFNNILNDLISNNNISLVHCDAADVLNYELMKVVEDMDKNIKYSCCNNAKMCCGEGVCGCCTRINNDLKLRRLCKMQTEPKYVLEGRRIF
ncbi:sulfide/dihydroorotate dehydrogenase-like FAD/NAD-binding protein [Clostridium sp. CM028]|uniref:sulfide/dihydroorotate dehydrogenase-like FAD/NAD-binding protein n=1 Tax=unclassified Clostridium TaxID=2614128 RepID=UPI001C0E3064|nr:MULTISPECIES: sulfide/dihydroorotate dehydrogenase-like FAD/NAD-binding protein [unclassified Clostridium]MBU3091579.1 sulfide/dihydroorotate dehydrogenase-like FAD/NAD-binding protein [Clostridium sp. CF011]MBW9144156.1 sulfide/dihydroorotate dehydrogenase-like FAD/NAD-binding protein [Clostridium sp. CM027]MBW9147533.1 sulfide/dihydroorotate dehydrogenase-like FAD/NAD-binding protein [Clostridium sp. CM028]UVE41201.1 sulfide/dihydroorotate dehydrogenase-like FAD/NAD-binding protein [Clostr